RRQPVPGRSPARHREARARGWRAAVLHRRPRRHRVGSRARLPHHRRRCGAPADIAGARGAVGSLRGNEGNDPRRRKHAALLLMRPPPPGPRAAPAPGAAPAVGVPAGYPGYIEAEVVDVRGRDLREYLWILYKYRWLAAACFGVVFGLTCLGTLLSSRVYTA